MSNRSRKYTDVGPGVIVGTASLLSLGLRRMRQPKVIAEVLGGIILGPTAFGRVPGFTEHIFPQDSRPYLSLVANIGSFIFIPRVNVLTGNYEGLCLFLFLVGLEIEGAVIKRNARLSAIIGFAGMILPFGLGAALAVPLYHQFIVPFDPTIKFTHFMLFTGVAYSITAFPVLCRILTELKLLDTTVGIVVLSAGVTNDVVGWTLLALSVALVNAGSGVTAVYILLCCVGWTIFLLFPVKKALLWLARSTGSIENGPTTFFMTITILLVFGSAFFTDVIGVHAIFGAFVMGIVVPREGGLAIALTEKLEDMVSIIFLPLVNAGSVVTLILLTPCVHSILPSLVFRPISGYSTTALLGVSRSLSAFWHFWENSVDVRLPLGTLPDSTGVRPALLDL